MTQLAYAEQRMHGSSDVGVFHKWNIVDWRP